jgi:hypothetical protein
VRSGQVVGRGKLGGKPWVGAGLEGKTPVGMCLRAAMGEVPRHRAAATCCGAPQRTTQLDDGRSTLAGGRTPRWWRLSDYLDAEHLGSASSVMTSTPHTAGGAPGR